MEKEISVEVTKKLMEDEMPGWEPFGMKPRKWIREKWEVSVTANRSHRLLMIVTDNYAIVEAIQRHYTQ